MQELTDLKILLVDDSRSFIALISTHLTPYQVILESVMDPSLAVQRALDFNPDIIITDYEMPGMNGLKLIELIRNEKALNETPIIFLTASEDSKLSLEAILVGCDDFISKQVFPTVLIPKIFALIRIRNRNIQLLKLKQTEAVLALVGTYKHELGNTLTILEGYWHLLRKNPTSEDIFDKGCNNILRIKGILNAISNIKRFEEEEYTTNTKILKITAND